MKFIRFKYGKQDVYIDPDAIIAIRPSTLFEDQTIITLISGNEELVSNPLENVIEIISKQTLAR